MGYRPFLRFRSAVDCSHQMTPCLYAPEIGVNTVHTSPADLLHGQCKKHSRHERFGSTFTTIWLGSCLGKGTVCFSRTSNPPVFETAIAWMVLGKDIFVAELCVVLERWRESWSTRILVESEVAVGCAVLWVKRRDRMTVFRNMQS